MRRRFFGQYLVAQGYITPPQLLAAVEYQSKYNTRLGELAVALGMITPFESEQINAAQLSRDRLFGETALDCGLMTARQLSDVLETQRNARVLLGQAIETLGYLQRRTIDSAHDAYLEEETEAARKFALPSELQDASHAWLAAVFDRAAKLMLRAWDLPSKPGRVRIEARRLTLSDRNARAELRGRVRRELLIGVPDDVACKAGRRYGGAAHFADALEDHAVQDFARILAEATAELLTARGDPTYLAGVKLESVRATLPPADRVVMVSFLTHLGQVLVGLTI
jgi:hypothetical protein